MHVSREEMDRILRIDNNRATMRENFLPDLVMIQQQSNRERRCNKWENIIIFFFDLHKNTTWETSGEGLQLNAIHILHFWQTDGDATQYITYETRDKKI